MPDFSTQHLDIDSLITFVHIAKAQSFSAAAKSLHKTRSTITYRIQTLEERVGAKLFNRTTRSVELTQAGQMLFEKATQILSWLQTLPDELAQLHDGVEPQFTLIFNRLLYEPQQAASLLAHLHQKFPHTDFKIAQAVYMGVWDALLYQNGHFAIGAPGFHTIDNHFSAEVLGVLDWVFVLSPNHPLANVPEALSDNALRQYPAINVEDSSMRLDKRIAWRLAGQQELLVPDFLSKIACHKNGLGVGFLPKNLAQQLVLSGDLIIKEVAAKRPSSPLSVAWKTEGTGKINAYLRQMIANKSPLFSACWQLLAEEEI